MDFQPSAKAKAKAHQPCAACRMLRRRCDFNCLLAPYFPGDEIDKFAKVHKVFGASNVIKMIQDVEETKKDDAVKALVYEATARLREPVYGSVRAIFHLQKMIQELKQQLESTRAAVSELQVQREELLTIHMKHDRHYYNLIPSPINEPIFDGFSLTIGDDTLAHGYDPIEFPLECDWIL